MKLQKRARILSLLFVLAACSASAGALDPQGVHRKKYVAFGWEFAYLTPQDFLDHAEDFMKTPLDGVGLNVPADKAAGRSIFSYRDILAKPIWTKEGLANLVPPMRKMSECRCFKESFVSAWVAPPKRLAWTDDAAWSVASNNLRAVAWLAREGHFRGVKFDTEDYTRQRQFTHLPGDPAYDETRQLARRRARDIFGGIFQEYPDMTLFLFWLLSDSTGRYVETDVAAMMRARGDLWAAFVNGLLDVLPPAAKVVDGQEDAYKYEASRRDFEAEYTRVFNWDLPLVAPENRAKYLAQTSLSFGQYIDMYTHDESTHWYFGPVDGSRLRHFARNLRQATRAATEYVWFWSESGRWIKWSAELQKDRQRLHGGAKVVWEEALPGFTETLWTIKDPEGHLLPRVAAAAAAGKLVDLMAGKACGTWKDPGRKNKDGTRPELPGRLYREGEEMCGEGLSVGGCFHKDVSDVKPGDVYFVTCEAKGPGLNPTASYRNEKGRWMFGPKTFLTPEPAQADGWRRIRAFVTLPEEAKYLSVALGFANQAEGETARYRRLHIYNVTDLCP